MMKLLIFLDPQLVVGIWAVSVLFCTDNNLLVVEVDGEASIEYIDGSLKIEKVKYFALSPRHLDTKFPIADGEVVVVHVVDAEQVKELRNMDKEHAVKIGILDNAVGIAKIEGK